mgnify:FL=1
MLVLRSYFSFSVLSLWGKPNGLGVDTLRIFTQARKQDTLIFEGVLFRPSGFHPLEVASMRIRQIALVAEHMEPVKAALMDLFGLADAHIDPKIQTFGLKNIVMTLGDTFLEVVSPIQEQTTAGRLLERRGGDGGYMVIVQVEDLNAEKTRLAGTDIRVVYNIDTERAKACLLYTSDAADE